MRKLKICYIGWAYSIHLQRFAGWFAKRGHEITLITDRYSPIDGVKQYEVDSHKFRNKRIEYVYNYFYYNFKLFRRLSNLAKIRTIIKKENPDIIHLHTLYFPAQLGVFTRRRPLIVMPWNGDIIWKKNRSIFRPILVRYALWKADVISAQTEYLREQCIVKYGARPDKINIIQFGVELDKFKKDIKEDKLRNDLQLNDNSIAISTRNISYNVLNIVRAIPYVIKQIPNARFIFIWPPNDPLETELKDLVDRLKISKCVRLIGSVDREKIPSYLSIADVFVSISLIETFPQSVLEAMAMGVIPVMGDIPPIKVYLEDNFNGFLVEPENISEIAAGIVKAIEMDEATKQVFIERNLNIVKEKADFTKEMEKMERLYYRLVPGKVFA
ncbi:MAG: glycosyltransferase family 4 protein [Nitrospirae bacterium]|nr:glycosyltransferase family 4 protein [Nitrospirota bacterium]